MREPYSGISTLMKRAAIVGSGPNGLSAAIALARAGVRVTVYEANAVAGGSVRTEEATLPGFRHDIGSAVFPMAIASPFFSSLDLEAHGLRWIEPAIPLAHPLDDGDAVALHHSLDLTVDELREDGPAWRSLMTPLLSTWAALSPDLLGPVMRVPKHPFQLARFGLSGLQSAISLARSRFSTPRARTLFAGLAGHSNVPLEYAGTSAVALILGVTAHAKGWPIAAGGAQSITSALLSVLRSFGGELVTSYPVTSLRELDDADCILLDVSPLQFLRLAGDSVSVRARRPFERFQRGSGTCKVDWALASPIPWTNALCRQAGTIHLGSSLEEIAASERAVLKGASTTKPYVLLAQPSSFDPSRAPEGRHTAWAYCHVPNGSPADATEAIEDQVERFAPGFGKLILARSTRNSIAMERWNSNLLGGDVSGGAMTLRQIIRRPAWPPYHTPLKGVFLCSSSTPPGGGVHGMCGALAAAEAARHMGMRIPRLV